MGKLLHGGIITGKHVPWGKYQREIFSMGNIAREKLSFGGGGGGGGRRNCSPKPNCHSGHGDFLLTMTRKSPGTISAMTQKTTGN